MLLILFILFFIRLSFPETVSAAISFQGGFESVLYQYPSTINNWHDPQPYPPGSRLTRVITPVRQGNWALRVEVNPGDNYGSSGERSELYNMYGSSGQNIVENESSGTQYYSISVYLPSTFISPRNSLHPNSDSAWAIFQQLHGSDVYHAPPVFAIGALNDFYVQMYSGDLDYLNDPSKSYTKKFFLGPIQLGKWVDFIWKIKYARNYTGSVDVWKRVSGDANFTSVLSLSNIPTLQFRTSVNNSAILNAYWRTGYYTSEETFTRTIYLDSHTRGDSFEEVAATAFPSGLPLSASIFTADTNSDNKIDLIDFSNWKKEYLHQLTTTTADFNHDNQVDLLDFAIWKQSYLKI